jgi:hypothetical protein
MNLYEVKGTNVLHISGTVWGFPATFIEPKVYPIYNYCKVLDGMKLDDRHVTIEGGEAFIRYEEIDL